MAVEATPQIASSSHVQTVDIAIIGAGPAGMSAAVTARRYGASVALLDEQTSAGGQIYRGVATAPHERMRILGPDYSAGASLVAQFATSGALHIAGAAVWQVTPEHHVHYLQDGAVRSIHARKIVLCTGAIERPFPIPGWTLPGVLTAGAGQILLKSSGLVPRSPVVIAGCGPLLYQLGWQYIRANVPIAAIVDTTDSADYRKALRHARGALVGWRYLRKGLSLLASLRRAGVPHFDGARDLQVLGDNVARGLHFVRRGKPREVRSPLVFLHHGVVPNTQFTMSLGAAHRWDDHQLCWMPVTDVWGELDLPGIFVAGDGRGIGGAQVAEIQGKLAALAATAQVGKLESDVRDKLLSPLQDAIRGHLSIRPFLDTLYRPKLANRIPADSTTVCRCEEVTAGDLRDCIRLGRTDPNQTKSLIRCGMGPCQGRQCGLTVTEILADARHISPGDTGHFRIRPPIKPITLGELADEA